MAKMMSDLVSDMKKEQPEFQASFGKDMKAGQDTQTTEINKKIQDTTGQFWEKVAGTEKTDIRVKDTIIQLALPDKLECPSWCNNIHITRKCWGHIHASGSVVRPPALPVYMFKYPWTTCRTLNCMYHRYMSGCEKHCISVCVNGWSECDS